MVQAYNYLLETYPIRREVMYPAHERSELRKVYNEIVNLSRRSPLYKIDLSGENQEYTIGIKETALYLKAELEKMSLPEESGFSSRTLSVSDEKTISAQLLSEDTEGLPDCMTIEADRLARMQVNRGKELLKESKGLPPGIYSFTAKVMDQVYPMTYIQEERVENQETLKKMSDLLNSIPGLSSSVEKGSSSDYLSLAVTSAQAGRYGEKAFEFFDSDRADRYTVVEYFGLDRIEQYSETALFKVNGEQKQTSTNAFYIENKLLVNIKEADSRPVTVKIVPDSKRILASVDSILDICNHLIGLARNRTLSDAGHYRATKLIGELKNLEGAYAKELDACGIQADQDGFLSLEEASAIRAVWDGGMESLFTRENGFIAKLIDKTEYIAINPLDYLDKIIITYPDNDEAAFRNPYITSFYSGLLFNSYC